MRILIATTLVASLITTNLLAAETAGPLAPGKAAGVQKAQEAGNNLWLLLGLGAGIAVVGLVASGGDSTYSVPVPTTPTTTTSAATST